MLNYVILYLLSFLLVGMAHQATLPAVDPSTGGAADLWAREAASVFWCHLAAIAIHVVMNEAGSGEAKASA